MKNQNDYLKTKIAVLVTAALLCCLCPSMVRADDASAGEGAAIAGLWHNTFTSSVGNPTYETYSQWHPDGLEIDTPNFMNAVCMGTYSAVKAKKFKLFHVGWTPGGTPFAPTSVRFELRELNKVGKNHDSFDGSYDQKYFDASGNVVFEDKGAIHAARLTTEMY